MQLYHFYHLLHTPRMLHGALGRFDTAVWIRVFGQSLVAVFIPIFLLRLSYTMGEVMRFYLLYMAINVPLNLLARWATRRFGAIPTIAAGLVAEIAFFVLLFQLTPANWPLLIALAAAAALSDALYWVAHLYFFMRVSPNDDNISGDMSALEIARQVGGIIAPAIGAAVLLFSSQRTLIAMSIVIIALSLLPLLTIRTIADRPTTPPLPFRAFFAGWDDARDYLARSLFAIHATAEGVILPLFIYITFTTIESVAAVPIIVAITTAVVTFFTGRMERRYRTRSIIIGSLAIAITWLLRLAFDAPFFLYGTIFLVGFFSVLVTLPVDSNLLEAGERKDALSASMYRNMFGMAARMVFFALVILLTEVFHVSFIIAAGSMLALAASAIVALPRRVLVVQQT
ncbi:MAG: MFS transporter [bacterium]|nr:MFS transporter [bacterium]